MTYSLTHSLTVVVVMFGCGCDCALCVVLWLCVFVCSGLLKYRAESGLDPKGKYYRKQMVQLLQAEKAAGTWAVQKQWADQRKTGQQQGGGVEWSGEQHQTPNITHPRPHAHCRPRHAAQHSTAQP